MKFLIKICGVTSPQDAEAAAAAGAGAIGINLWPGSKRYVDDERAREVARAIPPGVLRVGVFVNPHPLVVEESIAELRLDRIQLHGDERPAQWSDVPTEMLIRAIRVKDETSLEEAKDWVVGAFLYDSWAEEYGGQGKTAPWEMIATGARRPFLLSGGLTPDNVGDAIRRVRPDGVDVASGVESAAGVKDAARMKAFVDEAREAVLDLTDRRDP